MNFNLLIRRSALTVIVCLVMSSTLAHGTTVYLTLDGNFSPPDYDFYTYTDIYGTVHDSIPVGPYITYLNGGGYNNTLAYTFCYDFNSPTNVGTAYPGSFATPNDTATLEATYLIDQLNMVGLFNAPLATRGAISMAIWEIMNPSSATSGFPFPSDPAAQPYETEAAIAVTGGLWTAADSAVYPTWVPTDSSIQRFGTVLPEPASSVLIGSGILGLAMLECKRRSRRTGRVPSSTPMP
jgi:hypothetical protein